MILAESKLTFFPILLLDQGKTKIISAINTINKKMLTFKKYIHKIQQKPFWTCL